MPKFGDITIKAQLSNGKFIIIDPPKGMTIGWRYATPFEVQNNQVLTHGIFDWKTADVQTTYRGSTKVWYIVVDNTNIILNPYFE